jgi:hypothetical protein
MMISLLLMTSAPVLAPRVTGDPVAAASRGLNAVIEDDINPDTKLLSMKTTRCKTRVVAVAREWTIDWARAKAIALEDSFVYVLAPPVKFAIVADMNKPDQAAKLRMLTRAMQVMAYYCKPAR